MKSILLTTTAIVAFAGAAAADGHTSITHALSGTLGYNDAGSPASLTSDNEDGFYWEGNLKTTATATLDNGLTAGAYFEITINADDVNNNNDFGQALSSSDFVLSLTSDTAGLYYGDTSRAAEKHWASAGDMESDGFSTDSDSAVLRGDVSVSMIDMSVSYIIADAATAGVDDLQQLSVGASADFGMFSVAAAYQAEPTGGFTDTNGDWSGDEIMGLSGTATVGGATVTVAYADNKTMNWQSTGVKVSYPFGPVTATAYYVDENRAPGDPNMGVKVAYSDGPIAATVDWQDDQGTNKWSVNGSYDIGNGLSVFGGMENQNEGADNDYHVGGTYDLGGGASVLVTYAMDDDGDQADEIGSGDYQQGTTVELSFAF